MFGLEGDLLDCSVGVDDAQARAALTSKRIAHELGVSRLGGGEFLEAAHRRVVDERKLLELFASPSLIGRSVVAPPDMPRERVTELRRAFMATMQDPRFLEDVRRAQLEISPLTGEELQAAVVRSGNFPPAFIERARRAAEIPPN